MVFGFFSKKNYNKFKMNECSSGFINDTDYIYKKKGLFRNKIDNDNGWSHGIGIIMEDSHRIIGMIQHSQIVQTEIGINDKLISIDDLPVENINDIQFHLKGEPNSKIKITVQKPSGEIISCVIKRNVDSRRYYKLNDVIYDRHQVDIIKKLFSCNKF